MKTGRGSGIIGDLEYKSPGVKLIYWLFFAGMAIVSLVCILPALWVILSSLKDIKEFYAIPPTIIPRSFHLEKLWETWNEFHFMRYYVNTGYLTLGAVVFCLLFNGLAGYFFSKLKPKGSGFFFLLILWTILLPNTVGMVPLFSNLVDFPLLHMNFTNTYWPMWFMAAVNPVTILIFKNFFDTIPASLVEAARIDGATKLGIFFRIVLPLSIPVMITITILTINGVWMDFFWPYMVLKDQSNWTVMVAIYNLKSTLPMDIQFIALTFAIVPPVLLFLFFQRYIMQGYAIGGGVKG
ncbi:ABC transporter [Paenibacillus baekrokdamisoli]|uniref:ABC transporter n=1 Tax=Paenibacillus baekrokdamisoli TaxID=1712516 RepID=A0A3G9IT53_9BACL|nr:carbohydrate ABC transporter permease [Paenibacillus baekrokdamisoli]MBB3073374.1 multiple sugar transport system permease protein [Paenibacillus baekrokdamisoli]BBH22047.1 ABC transporter [Paenibacillus baekrokdamisoli]